MKVVKDKQEDFQQKWKEHKENYIKENSLESMVYENGNAVAFLYKEVQKLNANIMSVLNKKDE